ncbi:hypothetical protein M0R04_09070 [Candidatus Dojkabacteria bacterium]|nr:hypothetical protein [Candidatus Dojkabacteria bacterium]
MSVINNKKTTLVQLINMISLLQTKGFEVHIEGIGDTNVQLVFDNYLVLKNYSIPLNNI